MTLPMHPAHCDVETVVAHVERGPSGERADIELPASCARVEARGDGLRALHVDATLPDADDVILERDRFAPMRALDVALALEADHDGALLCLYQHKEWWMRPTWCEDWAAIPPRTQMVLWRSAPVTHRDAAPVWHLVLAACDGDMRADLRGLRSTGDPACARNLAVTVSTNQMNHAALAGLVALVADGDDPYDLVRRAAGALAARAGIATRAARAFPAPLEGLGWCTWDSLGQDVDEASILAKMDEFKSLDVPVSWVLIDDGWSLADRASRRLRGFDADPARFPQGLAHTVDELRGRYGVRAVGVWQAFQGYWAGVDPDSPVARACADALERLPDGCLVPAADEARAAAFWDRWDARLRDAGVDFVKVDSQSTTSVMARGAQSYGQAARGRHAALDAVCARRFDGALINCMGMAPEDCWSRPSSPIVRTSDDFFPRIPESLPEHAVQNAYCSLLMGELYHCDWDMFWSSHPHARTHALLRWIGGGPFYCSDALGGTDAALLRAFVREDGSIARPDGVGVPVPASLLSDPVRGDRALGVMNTLDGRRVVLFVGLNAGRAQTASIEADRALGVTDPCTGERRTLAAGDRLTLTLAYGECALRFVDDD